MNKFKRVEVTPDMYELIFNSAVFKMVDMLVSPIDKVNVRNLFRIIKEPQDDFFGGCRFRFEMYDYESEEWYRINWILHEKEFPRKGIESVAEDVIRRVLPIYFKKRCED